MADSRLTKQSAFKKKVSSLWMLVMVLFIGELFFYAWCRVQCTQMGYAITRYQRQAEGHVKTAYSLRVELASLRSHDRIINIAREEYGLVIPGPNQMVSLP